MPDNDWQPIPIGSLAAQQMTHAQPMTREPQSVVGEWQQQYAERQQQPDAGHIPNAGEIMQGYDTAQNLASMAGIIAGPYSRTANLGAMMHAKRLMERGYSMEDVFRNTGWFEHPASKQMMYEIPDQYAHMNIPQTQPYEVQNSMLRDRLIHPELFQAYPSLNDLYFEYLHPPAYDPKIPLGGYGTNVRGPQGDIGRGIMMTHTFPEDIGWAPSQKQIALHEVQHHIQGVEGFPKGAAGSDPNYERMAGEHMSNVVEQRDYFDPQQRQAYPPYEHMEAQMPYSQQVLRGVRTGQPWNARNWPGPVWDEMSHAEQIDYIKLLREHLDQDPQAQP